MVNFPSSFDDDTTLYIAVNNLRTYLTADISAGDTTIPVITTSGYPATGYISILTGGDITKTEAIAYTNTTGSSFTGATRGASGTTPYPHNTNDTVDLTIVADHHNELKNAIINLEHFVGTSGGENFLPLDDAGNVVIPGNLGIGGALSVQDSITVSGGATFYFATITGSLSVGSDITAVGTISGSEVKATVATFESATVSGEPVVIGDVGSSLTVKEADGSPTVANVNTIVVSNSTLTDDGLGQVTIQTGGSASGAFTDSLTISGATVATGTSFVEVGSHLIVEAKPIFPHPTSDFFDQHPYGGPAVGDPTILYIDFSKWSMWDPASVSGSVNGRIGAINQGEGVLTSMYSNCARAAHDGSTLSCWTGWYQSVPAGDFVITTKVNLGTFESNSNVKMGLFVAEDLSASPASADLFSCHLYHISGETAATDYSQYQASYWSAYNVEGTTSETAPSPFPGTAAWVRIAYRSSDGRTDASVSTNGIRWKEIERRSPLGFTPVCMGFGIWNGTAGELYADFELFATCSGFDRDSMRGHGRVVPIIVPAEFIA